jgi:hypothetical protein
MLLIVQIPIVDSRRFLSAAAPAIAPSRSPSWPDPRPPQHVRFWGAIRRRPLGGVDEYGEGMICDARGALRFATLPHVPPLPRDYAGPADGVRLVPRFRRFYFDGHAVGKFEIGFVPRPDQAFRLPAKGFRLLIDSVLNTNVHVRGASEKGRPKDNGNGTAAAVQARAPDAPCPLRQCLPRLARAYLRVSSGTWAADGNGAGGAGARRPGSRFGAVDAVTVGTPMLFLSNDARQHLDNPLRLTVVDTLDAASVKVAHAWCEWGDGRDFRFWHLQLAGSESVNDHDARRARDLRVLLLRLHAEQEGLRRVLLQVDQGLIAPRPRSPEARLLADYLNQATTRLGRMRRRAEDLDPDLLEVARQVELRSQPGSADALLQRANIIFTTLRDKLDLFPNVLAKIQEALDGSKAKVGKVQIIMGDNVRGSKYGGDRVGRDKIGGDKVGRDKNQTRVTRSKVTGGVGGSVKVGNISADEAWTKHAASIDLPKLADELAKLLPALRSQAAAPEQDDAVAAVSKAQAAATAGDGPKTFKWLRKAGAWALDTTNKIGVGLATAAIKAAMGM